MNGLNGNGNGNGAYTPAPFRNPMLWLALVAYFLGGVWWASSKEGDLRVLGVRLDRLERQLDGLGR